MAGRLGTTLETKQLKDWEQRWRPSSWKIGDDSGALEAGD